MNAERPIRPFEEQSLLEKYLRAELWNPARVLKLATEELPKAIRAKNWTAAGAWQAKIRLNQREVEKWTKLLDLYEAEFHAVNAIEAIRPQIEAGEVERCSCADPDVECLASVGWCHACKKPVKP